MIIKYTKSRKKQIREKLLEAEVILSDSDVQRIAKAIATLSKEKDLKEARLSKFMSLMEIIFTPVKKLKTKDCAISLVKLITSLTFYLLAWLGYIFAALLFLQAIRRCWQSKWSFAVLFFMSAFFVMLVSKLLEAASLEIEESKDSNMIFGVSAFLAAFMSVVFSIITLLKEVL